MVPYLKGTLGQGIFLRADSPLHITGWCDSEYPGCPLTRRSLTGWIVQFGSSPISWKTKKHDVVFQSSAEAEYRAMNALTKELNWLKSLLFDLGFDHEKPMTIRCDSQSAIHISSNPVFHECTKHIENVCHFVRDEIVNGTVKPLQFRLRSNLRTFLKKLWDERNLKHFFSSWALEISMLQLEGGIKDSFISS